MLYHDRDYDGQAIPQAPILLVPRATAESSGWSQAQKLAEPFSHGKIRDAGPGMGIAAAGDNQQVRMAPYPSAG